MAAAMPLSLGSDQDALTEFERAIAHYYASFSQLANADWKRSSATPSARPTTTPSLAN